MRKSIAESLVPHGQSPCVAPSFSYFTFICSLTFILFYFFTFVHIFIKYFKFGVCFSFILIRLSVIVVCIFFFVFSDFFINFRSYSSIFYLSYSFEYQFHITIDKPRFRIKFHFRYSYHHPCPKPYLTLHFSVSRISLD